MDKSLHSLPHYMTTNDTVISRKSSPCDFKTGSDVCPTCGGTGKVSKGQQDELVALIPYKDRRLKPRRTRLIIVIFVVIIVVMVITGTLLAVFLSPRNVTFTCSQVLLANWTNIRPVDEEDDETAGDDIKMTLQVHAVVKNYNYVSIKIKNIDISVSTRNNVTVGQYSSDHQMSASPRQDKKILILVNVTYKGDEANTLKVSCGMFGSTSVQITSVSTYQCLSHTSDTDDSSHFFVPCHNVTTIQ